MAVATLEKCACPKCSCAVSPDSAVKKGGKLYCSVACAEGHFSYQLSVISDLLFLEVEIESEPEN